ncbi:acyltransferase family protein [Paenibacillus cymbidii]|uniref:acyltransferase family protein n=1 Tax=Paenibacillus cymbidii TaxID=1639034 RepID=UPI001081CA0D|nr:acyltransferase family protein [Paenibacillus cymbidii]
MAKPKVLLDELFMLRSVACLSILLLHCIDRIYDDAGSGLHMFTVLLTFGTPTFVLISELILSRSYPERTPKRFWAKRLQFLLLPYVLFGVFYAAMKAAEQSVSDGTAFAPLFRDLALRHVLLGDYHGYFIIIIFQFYLLHMLFQRVIAKLHPAFVLIGALLIQELYLAFFNFTSPMDIPNAAYIWDKGYWLPCLGWLFYFTVAYYCGRQYDKIKEWLRSRTLTLGLLTIAAAALPAGLLANGTLLAESSKRFDMLPFTLVAAAFVLSLALRLKRVPSPFVWISRYSFGIYLFHPLYLAFLIVAVKKVPILAHNVLGVVFLFAVTLPLSVFSLYVLNKVSWGPYLVGKVGIGRDGEEKRKKIVDTIHNVSYDSGKI